jgi:hypothetical protein
MEKKVLWCWPQTHKHNRDTNQEDSASKILKEKVVEVVCTSEGGGGEGEGGRDREKEREEGWIGMRRGRERGGGREGGRDKERNREKEMRGEAERVRERGKREK